MNNRVIGAAVAVAIALAALVAGFIPVSAAGVSCGSAFVAASDADIATAQYGATLDNIYAGTAVAPADLQAACDSRRATQLAVVIPVLLISAGAGGFLVIAAQRRPAAQIPSAV